MSLKSKWSNFKSKCGEVKEVFTKPYNHQEQYTEAGAEPAVVTAGGTIRDTDRQPARADWKEQVLTDFSEWLEALPDDSPPATHVTMESCDLYTVLSEFSALRQEIKLRNREQNRVTGNLAQMREAYEKSMTLFENSASGIENLARDIRFDAETKTVLPFLDVRDALVRGHAACMAVINKRRWFRRAPKYMQPIADGYETALRRFDRGLASAGITPIETVGQPFDPKQMKATGSRDDSKSPPETVLAEEAGGFVRGDEVIRKAEVVVNTQP